MLDAEQKSHALRRIADIRDGLCNRVQNKCNQETKPYAYIRMLGEGTINLKSADEIAALIRARFLAGSLHSLTQADFLVGYDEASKKRDAAIGLIQTLADEQIRTIQVRARTIKDAIILQGVDGATVMQMLASFEKMLDNQPE